MNITFEDVLYSSELQGNFISVTRVVDRDITVKFDANTATARRQEGTILFRAKREGTFLLYAEQRVIYLT